MTDPIVLQATGDVKGPASSTDNSMVLFSGTSGKVIKGNNAVVTAAGLALLDDNNNTEQRNTLGLGTIATQNSNAVTISGGTITGITDLTIADGGTGASTAAQARTNLGLGNSATLNVGTTANTVAAGNDSRIVNAVPNVRTVYGTEGLTGGGPLTGDVVIKMGPPTTINKDSWNFIYGASHTHQLDINSFFPQEYTNPNGYIVLPGNFVIQWGSFYRGDIAYVTNFTAVMKRPMEIMQAFATSRETSQAVSCAVGGFTPGAQQSTFLVQCWERDGTAQGGYIGWLAFGRF